MFCLNCFYPSTHVTNSRPHKRTPSVWRRRTCQQCQTTFTTIERPSLADNKQVFLSDGSTDTFSLGKLIISISGAFSHDPRKAQYDSHYLAQTVEDTLSAEYQIITPDDIAAVTHQVLKRFDELAAVQYAAKHRLIETTRRRGRPSISPASPERRTDASPSQ
jgi:transcriptional repressor NrdR